MKIPLLNRLEKTLRFIRRNSPLKLDFAKLYYSQHGEDVFVKALFEKRYCGFYVDVGAHHPFRYSNTAILYRAGWRGINIEPLPEGIAELKKYRPQDINIKSAVSAVAGEVSFSARSALSGIQGEHYILRDKPEPSSLITVQSQPLSQLLAEQLPADQGIDVLSVDCEGYDNEVLSTNDWSRFRPKVVLVEDHEQGDNTETDRLMSGEGYHFIVKLGFTKAYRESSFAIN